VKRALPDYFARHNLIALALLILAAASVAQTNKAKAPPPTHSFARKLKLQGVTDFAEVTPDLYGGAQPSHDGLVALTKMGIDVVVDLRGTRRKDEERDVHSLGMKYLSIPWHCPFPRDDIFARFLKVIKVNPGKKVFVHCRLGDDRGGMMIAAYRMAAQGWSAKEAREEMEQFGFGWSHHLICPELARYESDFPEHLRTNPVFRGLVSPEAVDDAK